ncbi:putative transcription factor [Thermochaetoides thermophila DSM 1495]|uniref:Putative transcription factor n=1 Tax=Chaetomium thermophilum (strain DSM 1495 / CBS 144.50 / IMI 039719) TaxID=759272 RepID=G0SGM3_CHATD|nr:putative transcription factor [Thermochaetoides thermophila DSM 1495]EGS17362.1 putative transcription factor [Thermochaetoides thermophila DSM 1495]
MSTASPSHQRQQVKTSQVKMAASTTTTTTKAKTAKVGANDNPKQKTVMHRRSRTGCYTCRLRRKKCDEAAPICTACRHLGLVCEYKRPMWWSNNDLRRKTKEEIKMIIKRKKLSDKSSHTIQTSVGTPPGLSHSLPTSATFSGPMDRTRSASIDSHFGFNFNSPPSTADFGPFTPPQVTPEFMFPYPYEIDVKTERQMFIDDVQTLHESTTATYSYAVPPPPGVIPPFPLVGEWTEQVYSERRESLATTEETVDLSYFDAGATTTTTTTTTKQLAIELDEGDQRLLDHFIKFVLPMLFPILEATQTGSTASDLILPSLQTNKAYLHVCLSIAAQHYKQTMGLTGEAATQIDNDIMNHRSSAIAMLVDALNRDEDHQQILEAALGFIFFQRVVGRLEDSLSDVAWHQHFQAVIALVQKLDLPRLVSDPNEPLTQAPFGMTLTAWVDILGATFLSSPPVFAHTYRTKHLSPTNPFLGLRELMGCEDRVMYLISEIACLEALKKNGMDDMTIIQHAHTLGEQINITELYSAEMATAIPSLSRNITAAYRLAARIYLCSLIPGFHPTQGSCIQLVDKLVAVLRQIPAGPTGFDRSLSWVYLIGGSVALAGSPFRAFLEERVALMGDLANIGSFGRVATLLREVWAQQDVLMAQQAAVQSVVGSPRASPPPVTTTMEAPQQQTVGQTAVAGTSALAPASQPYVHWRDVMQMKGWDYLLI